MDFTFIGIEAVHLAIAILIGVLALGFLKKHGKSLGKASIFFMLAIVLLAVYQIWEIYVELFNIACDPGMKLIENTIETAVLAVLAIALVIEAKASEKAK